MPTRKKKAAVPSYRAGRLASDASAGTVVSLNMCLENGAWPVSAAGVNDVGRDGGVKDHEQARPDRLDTATAVGDEWAQGAGVDNERV